MTVVAIVAAGKVRWMLADCNNAIMARSASPQDLCVVDNKGRRPYIWIVAILTNIRRKNMCRTLARCFDTVVTAYAIAGDVQVIEICREPACG